MDEPEDLLHDLERRALHEMPAESGDVARGATEAEARAAAMELSLYEVKTELDRAIERRREALEE